MVCTIGAFIIAAGILTMIINFIRTLLGPKDAPNDPWDGATLEWSLPSPPPVYNFRVEPIVRSRDAWWAWKRRRQAVEAGENVATLTLAGHEIGHAEFEEEHPSEEYLAQEANFTHGDPSKIHMPNPSFFPLIAALGLVTMAVGMIFSYVLAVIGFLYLVVAVGAWAMEPTG
jgi:cytochrome c oxidase subunit 1